MSATEPLQLKMPYAPWAADAGYQSVGLPPKTVLELDMCELSATIREKPDWHDKYTNPTIVAKWREEVGDALPEKAFEYVISELQFYHSLRTDGMEMSGVDGVWQGDGCVPTELKRELLDVVSALENVPDSEKDWHPGSNQQVLDLVHPSLFPLIYGVTRTISDPEKMKPSLLSVGGGEIIPPPTGKGSLLSKKFQWLPAEFQVHNDGHVSIESYINNLHPINHNAIYATIAKIFEKFVPLFSRVLSDLKEPMPTRINVDPYDWYDESQKPDSEDSDFDEDDWHDNKPLKEPVIPSYTFDPKRNPLIDLSGRHLQVIVKLANIILTPEKPDYPGGSWHIEGMENEQIVAAGIYYYKSENITESRLMFRQAIQEPDYEQDDRRGVEEMFGLADGDPLNQNIGSVKTQEDRCLAFPNIYQHRVAPFSLQDKTKPGIRKILVFFLVDPTKRIVSTASVPPQQKEWYFDCVKDQIPFRWVPSEIAKHIVGFLDFPLSLDQARKYREELMTVRSVLPADTFTPPNNRLFQERKYYVNVNNENLYERSFSLCEH